MPDMNIGIDHLYKIAADPNHGYSQPRRDEEHEDDCSSSSLDAIELSGFDIGSATYTGNSYDSLIKAGFQNVTGQINRATGEGLKKADVCLRPPTKTRGGHMAVMVSNTELCQAAGDFDGKRGDSSGKEIRIRPYVGAFSTQPKYILRAPQAVPQPTPVPTPEPVLSPEHLLFAVQLKEAMNIRKGPGLSYAITEVAPKNRILGISAVTPGGAWGRIQNSKNKWVCITQKYVERIFA